MPVEALRYEGGAGASRKSQAHQMSRFQVGLRKSETLRSLWSRRGRTVLTIVGHQHRPDRSRRARRHFRRVHPRDGQDVQHRAMVDLVARQAGASDIGYSAISERVGKQIAAIPGVESVSGLVVGAVTMEQDAVLHGHGLRSPGAGHSPFQDRARARAIRQPRDHSGPPGGRFAQGQHWRDVEAGRDGLSRGGVFETGVSWEESGMVIPLRDGQAILGKPRQVSLYAIKVQKPEPGRAGSQADRGEHLQR